MNNQIQLSCQTSKPHLRRHSGNRGAASVAERFPTVDEREQAKALAAAEAQRCRTAHAEMQRIRDGIEDGKTPLHQICRLIALRMVSLLLETEPSISSRPLRWLDAERKGLVILRDTLRDLQKMERRQDVLDLEGSKFKKAIECFVGFFATAMQQAQIPGWQIGIVMRNLRDVCAVRNDELRREVAAA